MTCCGRRDETLEGLRQLPLGSASVVLLSGDSGTAQTIELIRREVDRGVKSADVNRYAIACIRRAGATPYDQLAQAHAIWAAVADPAQFTYVADPIGPFGAKETVRPASVILQTRGGDCDDLNGVLIPSLMGTIGLRTRLVTVATDPEEPNAFTHVYSEVEAPFGSNQWYAVDAARPDSGFGIAPEIIFRKQVWSLSDDSSRASMFGVRHSLSGYVKLGGPACAQRRRLDGLRTMGDSSTPETINAITSGTTDILTALRANPGNLYSVATTAPGSGALAMPGAGYSPYSSSGYVNTPFGVMHTGSAIFLGLAALVGVGLLVKAMR